MRYAAVLLFTLAACQTMESGAGNPVEAPKPKTFELTEAEATQYLNRLAPMLAGRVLDATERTRISEDPKRAVQTIVADWLSAPYFATAAREMIQHKLQVSGDRDGINFNLPGNLAQYIVERGLPYSTIITANYCIDDEGAEGDCDSGAPFNAGVLGTRAYLASRAGRFNLTRASTMMLAFACSHYPMDTTVQPRVAKETLVTMFRAETAEEQMEAAAAAGFGNGLECYACHGQFAAHAQVFVRFDEDGNYHEDATGLQDTAQGAELGRSKNKLFTSHFAEAAQAKSNASQMFGQSVDDLAGAAQILATSPEFVACGARNLLEYALAVDGATQVDDAYLDAIADRAQAIEKEPQLTTLALETFTDSHVIRSIVPEVAP